MNKAIVTIAVLGLLTGCGDSDDGTVAVAAPATTIPTEHAGTPTTQPSPTVPSTTQEDGVQSTIVRFATSTQQVDVTITADNPTVRDFMSLLPLALTLEEFKGREKISYLPQKLDTGGSPGHDPEDGDLIYFAPWGNLGFYYNTEGIGHDDQVIHLGTYDATLDQLAGLEGGNVTVEVVR